MLLLCVQLAARARDRRSRVWLAALLALTRAALLFTWHGSLLYLAVLESTLLGLALLARDESASRAPLYESTSRSPCIARLL